MTIHCIKQEFLTFANGRERKELGIHVHGGMEGEAWDENTKVEVIT